MAKHVKHTRGARRRPGETHPLVNGTSALWTEAQIVPPPLDRPPGTRVLVLAPHMDDETLGCGGSLHRHVTAGEAVTIVYMTDGRKGDPALNARPLPPAEREHLEDALAAVRREEARQAAAVLGVRDLRFLENRDQELRVTPHTRRQVRELLEDLRPDLVYVPFPTDHHPDHRATNRILLAALAVCRGIAPPLCCGYEVWAPIEPNCLVDITPVADVKQRALAQFQSQMATIDYSRCIMGLHAYRSMVHLHGRGFVEAFVLLPAAAYRRAASRILRRAGGLNLATRRCSIPPVTHGGERG
jgi:LmbE family N-acetylglucosaminyl deacetylase